MIKEIKKLLRLVHQFDGINVIDIAQTLHNLMLTRNG